ncbi:hypothetical protein CVH10_13080 [Halomonas sp. ND22Bw]|uniref:Lipoprotein n=1 Tax=Halomonas salina TaxID=42565 RepID=A0ABR4WT58_9GAMM|nr:hypothetical protein [Halomonas salina]KGE77891.1 hypothetical protein FP66_06755 [Halomonas salina]PSJ21262.1 hypothetical protein CVH10_13080 [Halomonas sp. ND22Bw]
MLKRSSLVVLLSLLTACATSSDGEVGITDDCQADIRTLEAEINDNRDRYTLEARTKANAELLQAKTNRFNPVKCRLNIQDARSELRRGRRD